MLKTSKNKQHTRLVILNKWKTPKEIKESISISFMTLFFNLHCLAKDKKFITTIQDLMIFSLDDNITKIFKTIIKSNNLGLPAQSLSYDTTFNLGKFYLSILSFRQLSHGCISCTTEKRPGRILVFSILLLNIFPYSSLWRTPTQKPMRKPRS